MEGGEQNFLAGFVYEVIRIYEEPNGFSAF